MKRRFTAVAQHETLPSHAKSNLRIPTFTHMNIICIGGGAASFFFAANLDCPPGTAITILEQGKQVLGKVAISGGGRCNVTHHCFDPNRLIEHYPRGTESLLQPFREFGPKNTVTWFEQRGVKLKVEADGRMFPVTDTSRTIVDALTKACRQNNVLIRTGTKVRNIKPVDSGKEGYTITLLNGEELHADVLFLAPGGSKQIWQVLEHMGHTIVPPVPSLFTFQISDHRLHDLAGISLPMVTVKVNDSSLNAEGPLLITHKGLSGPAILKLSAFGAREFHSRDYRFEITIDFSPQVQLQTIKHFRDTEGKKLLGNYQLLDLPRRLAQNLLASTALDLQKKYASASNAELETLYTAISRVIFQVTGQNRFKEEFVTAGGVDLSEIDLGNFSSKLFPNLHLAGEVLNIDGVTGGFNFQAAWTGAYLAARAISQ